MKKKNRIMVVGQGLAEGGSKHAFQRLQISEHLQRRGEAQTERGNIRKSKSPLQARDTNRLKTKPSTSKSPLRLEPKPERPSGLPRKVAPLNLQGLSISALGSGGGELSRTLTTRRSVKKHR
jgi:hypothetical protein